MQGKAWTVGSLLVAALCVTAAAGFISGSWFTVASFEKFQPLEMGSFRSDLVIDYTTCGWTFGALAYFRLTDFTLLAFDTAGEVGPFDLYGVAAFSPTPGAGPWHGCTFLRYAIASVAVSIAGVNAYAVPVLSSIFCDWNHWSSDQFGTGLLVGGWGSFGDCSVWAQARSNMAENNFLIFHEGYDALLWRIGPHAMCPLYRRSPWVIYSLEPLQTGCCLCWTGANVIVQAPVTCLDLTIVIDFTCDRGFNYTRFLMEDICLGLSWLELAYLDITFGFPREQVHGQVEGLGKAVDWRFDLIVADCVCFTPYLSIVQSGPTTLDGIALRALTVEYDMGQGVTFKAGHRFTEWWEFWYDFLDWCRYEWFGFTQWGEVVDNFWDPTLDNCIPRDEYEEYIALEIAGDTCCGGAFNAWVFNWFDSDDQWGGFMDWAETGVGLDVGIGSNTTLSILGVLSPNGIRRLHISAEILF